MIHIPFTSAAPMRPTLQLPSIFQTQSAGPAPEQSPVIRSHGVESRSVTLPNASSGGGAISKSQDGQRCVVAGRESLRILRISDATDKAPLDHKFVVGRGGYRIEASRNMFSGSGLKYDNILTDVLWGHHNYNQKILAGTRSGELIVLDLQKSGSSKYERKVKDHTRAINKISYSSVIPHFCCTGSSDGNLRLWDLRELSKSKLHVHHTMSIRTLMMSPSISNPLHVVTGTDNGTLTRWDLRMGQKGKLDRTPVAHSAAIMSLDWCIPRGVAANSSGGWLVSAGLDQCVKVWDLSNEPSHASASGNFPRSPTYTLHTPYPIRRVCWRPGHETELAIASTRETSTNVGSSADIAEESNYSGSRTASNSPTISEITLSHSRSASMRETDLSSSTKSSIDASVSALADVIEIWDVRRSWIAKWRVKGSDAEGGVSDMTFADSQALWSQHSSGAFSQIDLRHSISTRPIDSVPRTALTWDPAGTLTFVSDKPNRREVPYDDVSPDLQNSLTVEIDESPMHSWKRLGDEPQIPSTQHLGICVPEGAVDAQGWDVHTFAGLAAGYKIHGNDRGRLCEDNAEVAFSAGEDDAAQTWLLLQSLLLDVDSKPPTPKHSPRQSHSRLAQPATFSSTNSSPAPLPRTSSIEARLSKMDTRAKTPSGLSRSSPRQREGDVQSGKKSSHSESTIPTPSISPAMSPTSPLKSPPFTTLENGGRSSPISGLNTTLTLDAKSTPISHRLKSRRQASVSVLPASVSIRTTPSRLSEALKQRRASVSAYSSLKSADGYGIDGGRSMNLRHVGEGALDDSDSSEDNASTMHDALAFGRVDKSGSDLGDLSATKSTEDVSSPQLKSSRPRTFSISSVSTVDDDDAEHDDEKDEMTVSPGSSETDSDDSVASTRRRRSSSTKRKTRSRSSTNVSQASRPQTQLLKPLPRQESGSSIQTIVAGHNNECSSTMGQPRDLRNQSQATTQNRDQRRHSRSSGRDIEPSVDRSTISRGGTNRDKRRSQALSVSSAVIVLPEFEEESETDQCEARFLRWNGAAIREAEADCRQIGWITLQETIEELAEEGDVQMCAMLSCIAGHELGIPPWRTRQFVETYIDLLSKLRLHTSAAYIRKHSISSEVGQMTQQHTTIYTNCAKCRKALINPVIRRRDGRNMADYSYCSKCKQSNVKCSICHLPVRASLFVCAICSHGGHQECYRKYYSQRPMIELFTSTIETRGRKLSRTSFTYTNGSEEGFLDPGTIGSNAFGVIGTGAGAGKVTVKAMGHPCAAGCGHFCWAATEKVSAG